LVIAVSDGGLSRSLPSCVHSRSIKPLFYGGHKPFLFRVDFELRCFQPLFLKA